MDCDDCRIEDKVTYCCRKHPITDEIIEQSITTSKGLRTYFTCPEFNLASGCCKIYSIRPIVCSNYDCNRDVDEDVELWGLQ